MILMEKLAFEAYNYDCTKTLIANAIDLVHTFLLQRHDLIQIWTILGKREYTKRKNGITKCLMRDATNPQFNS